MIKKLDFYVKKYEGFIDKNICKKTVKELNDLKKNYWSEHVFYNPALKKDVKLSGAQELSTSYTNEISTEKEIMNLYWKAIYKYVLEDIKNSWFDSWSGFSKIRYNKYSSTKKMAEHCDHITMIFDGERKGIPILSVLSVLNNDYLGGEFFMFQDKKIKLNEGDVLIFPSNFLYPHKVDPVTKGTRYSIISWVW
jgi:hypothetical protein